MPSKVKHLTQKYITGFVLRFGPTIFFDEMLLLDDGNRARLIENRELNSLWLHLENENPQLFPFVDLEDDLNLENYWHLEDFDFYSTE